MVEKPRMNEEPVKLNLHTKTIMGQFSTKYDDADVLVWLEDAAEEIYHIQYFHDDTDPEQLKDHVMKSLDG